MQGTCQSSSGKTGMAGRFSKSPWPLIRRLHEERFGGIAAPLHSVRLSLSMRQTHSEYSPQVDRDALKALGRLRAVLPR